MQRSKKPKNFLPKPVYKGGPKAMGRFIKETLKYPPEAIKEKAEGTVVIRMDIDFKGKVVATKVKTGVGYGCDEEAQRVAKLLKFELESSVRKGRILYHKTINIRFKLPKTKPAPKKKAKPAITQTQLTYNVVSSSKKPVSSSSSNGGYTYTIKY